MVDIFKLLNEIAEANKNNPRFQIMRKYAENPPFQPGSLMGIIKAYKPSTQGGRSALPDSFWEPKLKIKKTKVDRVEDKINLLEERLDNANNASYPNDNLIKTLEKQLSELHSLYEKMLK